MRGPIIRQSCSAVVVLTLLAACGRSDKAPAGESASAPGASRRGLAAPTAGGAHRSYPGALTKPIDAYSGDELYELTRSLHFAGSHERQRKCRNAAGCEGATPARHTLVQVSAVATQDSVSAATVPQFGVVYVRAINRGDTEEARYGLRPSTTLRYYAIVSRDSAGALAWRLEELETAAPRRHRQIASGTIHSCGHGWRPGARADFRSCAQGDLTDTVVTLPFTLRQTLDDPLWTMCDQGCCEFLQ